MKQIFTVLFVLSAAALAQAQPVIKAGGVVNAASYAAPGLPNGAIAPGSLFVIFGTNLGPAALQQSTAYPLSGTLAGTSLSVTVNGTTTKPLMIYTSAGQLAALLPSTTPVGTGTVSVTYNGATSPTQPIQVASSSFGIFSANSSGSGLGAITNQGFQSSNLTNAANPGEAFIIFGTGVGPSTGDETGPGSGLKLGTIPVEVLVGGKSATIYGYARAPQFSGLDQIAFAVPAGVTGCSVPVAVKIGNVISNYVTLPIAASGRTCSDPAGLGTVTVNTNGTVSVGSVDLSRTAFALTVPGVGSVNSVTDSGSGSFYRYAAIDYSTAANPLQISTFGSCTVFTFTGTSATSPNVPNPKVLDAGPQLTVSGPGGPKTLTKMSGSYSAQLGGGTSIPGVPSSSTPLYLTKGAYTVAGPGGADVGPFTATLNVPDPLNWTNASITTVNRAAGQLITWNGGDPTGNVYIIGYSISGTNNNNAVGAEFVCVERTSAGQFTVPSSVLLSLPASSATLSTGGILGVEGSTIGTFKASGLDQGTISASSFTLSTVTYQ